MTDWLLLLIPVALFAILSMCLLVGCGLDSSGLPGGRGEKPPPKPYKKFITETNDLVAYWRLGEPSGSLTAVDELGNHHGTYKTAAPVAGIDTPDGASAPAPGTVDLAQPGVIAGEPGTSVIFNGGYVEVPHVDDKLDPPEFSVEAWVVPLWDQAERAFRSVVTSRDDVSGQAHGYVLCATPLSGDPDNQYRWEAWAANGTGSGLDANTRAEGDLVVFHAATHLVMTFKGADLKLYVDGTLRGQAPATGFAPNTARPLRIGAGATELEPPANIFPFNGQIQEVALYSRALTEQEVATHFFHNPESE